MTHRNPSLSDVIIVEDSPCSSSTFSSNYTSLLGEDLRHSLKRKRRRELSVQVISSDEDVSVAEYPGVRKESWRRKRIDRLLRENVDLVATPTTLTRDMSYPRSHSPQKTSSKKNRKIKSLGETGETLTSVDKTNNLTILDNEERRKGKKKCRPLLDFHLDSESRNASLELVSPKIIKKKEKSSETLLISIANNILDVCQTFSETPKKKKKKKKVHESDISSQSNISNSEENEFKPLPKDASKATIEMNDGNDSDNCRSNENLDVPENRKLAVVEPSDESDDPVNNTIVSLSSDAGAYTSDVNNQTFMATNDTILLSDDDDDLKIIKTRLSTSSDIIVLGTPSVPTVTNYKGISKNRTLCNVPGSAALPLVRQPSMTTSGILPSTVANAIKELSKIPNWMELLAAQSALQSTNGNSYNQQPPLLPYPRQPLPDKGGQMVPSYRSSLLGDFNPKTFTSPDNKYGSNIYNPSHKSNTKQGLRPVIIDGSNVGMCHGLGKFFSAKGLEICVNYFVKRKHKVHAFLPMFRKKHLYTRDCYILHKLERDKHLIYTPSRIVDGENDVPYDDRYIVQTAAELGGVIVSTDNYRDLLEENESWHDTIKNRLLMFTWVEDILMFPQDPLGKRGPTLEAFLRF